MVKKNIVLQSDLKDCGLACMLSIIKYYGGYISIEKLREMTKTKNEGTNAFYMKEAFHEIGFVCKVNKCVDEEIKFSKIKKPFIAHLMIDKKIGHYVIVYEAKRNYILIMDPSSGYKKMKYDAFYKLWSKIIITVEPYKKIPVIDNEIKVKDMLNKIIMPHRKTIIKVIVLSFLFNFLNIINTFYFQYIIDRNIVDNNFYTISVIFLFIMIIKNIIDYIRSKLVIYLDHKIDTILFSNTIAHIISLPYNFYRIRTSGEIISRINDLSYIREMISRTFIIIFVDSFLALFALIYLFMLNQILFTIIFIVLFLYIIILILFRSSFKDKIDESIKLQAEVNSCLFESINYFETTKGLNLEKVIFNKVKSKYDLLRSEITKLNNAYNFQNSLKSFINNFGLFLILFIGCILNANNQITIGMVMVYSSLFLYFIEPFKSLFDLEMVIRQSITAIKRIAELYQIDNEKFEEKDEIINGDIIINNLEYSYDNSNSIFEKLNYKIIKGEKIIVVGDSGAGKSTFVKLLLGYYKTNRNQIVIDNIDINDYSKSTLRKNISYVSQNETLFTDTIYNNVNIKEDNEDRYKDVSNTVLLNEFTNYEESKRIILEENGTNLSGGERQRVVLARALMKDSSILILDESTSQLDIEKERIILSNIFNKYKDKTIIVISHRLDNVDLFNQVIKLEKGE